MVVVEGWNFFFKRQTILFIGGKPTRGTLLTMVEDVHIILYSNKKYTD
jgi:hypothetical protein